MDKPVVIIGSGFSGFACAFHLAEAGYKVKVIEKKDVLGGYFRELQRQFPTNSCGACFMHPDYPAYCPHIEGERHRNIECFVSSDVLDIQSNDDSAVVTVQKPSGSEIIDARAAVLATGYEIYDIAGKPELGGGIYDNVYASLDMERMIYDLSAQGKKPEFSNVAYIQCVGSRDLKIGRPYCSSFCCMFAIKQALMLKEINPGINITIFYMDIRSFGKDYERYYRDAQEKGIRFIRSAVGTVRKRPATGRLELLYTCDGGPNEETFDAVVLSQGAGIGSDSKRLFDKLGKTVDVYAQKPFDDIEIAPNVFVTGSAIEPMDIPDSVVDGISVASRIIMKGEMKTGKVDPVKVKVAKAKKIDIIALGIPPLTAKTLHEKFAGLIPLNSLAELETHVKENIPDGCVIISDNIRFVEGWLKGKDYCNLHINSVQLISSGSADINEEIETARYRMLNVQRNSYHHRQLNGKVLVIGGGVAGLTASRTLARLGSDVLLVEKSNELGGRLRDVNEREVLIQTLIAEVEEEGKVEILKGHEVKNLTGKLGDFNVTVESAGEVRNTRVGAVLIATGGTPRRNILPFEDDKRVFTFFDFDKHEPLLGLAKTVAMLQCAGSRTDENPVCYRVCCTKALNNAIQLKNKYPEIMVYIFHRDIRAYGYNENLYREARKIGIQFIRTDGEPDIEPRTQDMGVRIKAKEQGTAQDFSIDADYLILSSGINPDTADISSLANLDTKDGFLVPYNKKSGVLDLHAGIYGAGLALAPNYTPDVIKQAEAAALRIALKLAGKELVTRFNTAFVNPKYCCGCELCVKACPVSARHIDTDTKTAQVDETMCEGCGTCAMVCTNKASQHKTFEHKGMLKTIDVMMK